MLRSALHFGTLACCLLHLGQHHALAANVYVIPQVTAVLNPDFSPVDASQVLPDHRLLPRDEPYFVQVDVRVQIPDLSDPLAGLASTAFDVQLFGDGVVYFDESLGLQAWSPDNPKVDINGPAAGGIMSKWLVNRDGGADPNDLIQIELVVDTGEFGPVGVDLRRTIGRAVDNELVGTFYLELPGEPGSSASAKILMPYESFLYDRNGARYPASNQIGGVTPTYRVVPEPGALLLAVIGGLVASSIRWRRTA